MRIRGLLLPQTLVDAIADGRWMRSAPGREISGSSSWSAGYWDWCFYDSDQISSETETIIALGRFGYPGFEAFNPDRVLCIADRGRDWPICLIHSDADTPGSVFGFNAEESGWEKLADSFVEFANKLIEAPEEL